MASAKGRSTNDYWQGRTEERLNTLSSDIKEIKDVVKSMNDSIDGLRLWKAKIAGISASASAVVVLIVKALEKGVEPLVQTLLPRLVAAGPDSPVGREVAVMMRSALPEAVRRPL